jgi:hypothetical protein
MTADSPKMIQLGQIEYTKTAVDQSILPYFSTQELWEGIVRPEINAVYPEAFPIRENVLPSQGPISEEMLK